jgi:SAM-dependent methyltransferase
VFTYLECGGCRSLYCDPMPDGPTLARMYGTSYAGAGKGSGVEIADPRVPARVVEWLARQPAGTFLDFGCGGGALLRLAQQRGWRAVGIEFDPDVAARVATATGARVATGIERDLVGSADVVNVGDVIEHLTDPVAQMQDVLRLLKPGGVLLAQGPLEANRNLFTAAMRVGRTLRPRPSHMPPFHVTLATAQGQRRLFERLGLEQVAFQLSEVDWPAPSRIGLQDLTRPRVAALYTIRKLSLTLGALGLPDWGNRYFFVGRVPTAAQAGVAVQPSAR